MTSRLMPFIVIGGSFIKRYRFASFKMTANASRYFGCGTIRI
jgi:hypothetical protein